jgi:hypothetical protein
MSLQHVLSVRAPVPIGAETASAPVDGEPDSTQRPGSTGTASFGESAPAPYSSDPTLVLLDGLTVQVAERVLVLGHGAIELICALIRGGSREVTELRTGDRPEAGTADLVLVPRVKTADQAVMLVSHARRALVPTGRAVFGVSGHLAAGLVRVLRLHGFTAICRRDRVSGSVVSAILPAFPASASPMSIHPVSGRG